VSFQNFFKKAAAASFAALCVLASAGAAQSTLIVNGPKNLRVAERNNLYCAGYVQTAGVDTTNKIVGAVDEQDGFLFSQHEVVWLNYGASKGAKAGDVLSVFRPRGTVNTRWTRKGSLGFYVQEVGAVEIIRVKNDVSVARVKTSCDNFLLGDLVQPMQERVSPMYQQRPALDLFGDPNGKALGRLFMARDNLELLSAENIVYVDLGAEDSVQVGDYLTIFRPLGDGNPYAGDWGESAAARSEGYQSFEYRGGKFSNQTARKSGEHAGGRVVTTRKAKSDRSSGLRKVVGEMVILNVKERTATAVITRNAQEIHTGDWVEVQ
jgi:hypothetical protein